MTCPTGHRPRKPPDASAIAASRLPPIRMRLAPTVIGVEPSGPSAWAVPVVPKRIAAIRTWVRAMRDCYTILQSPGKLLNHRPLRTDRHKDGTKGVSLREPPAHVRVRLQPQKRSN